MRRSLEGSGQVGHDLLEVDWDRTPLGQPDTWPQSLRSAVRILLTSKFAMWMAWGPDLTFFCNDAYRQDTLGDKYPWALGKPAYVVWSEIWSDIEPRISRVMQTGEATWDESLQLFLERSGFVEETYHTFSYSPLFDDDGRIAGMLCVVIEDTEKVVATRRMSTLRDLGTRSSDLTEVETLAAACDHLGANPWSLPFTAIYLFDPDGRTARLAGGTGFRRPHPIAPEAIALDDMEAAWPVSRLIHRESVLVDDLGTRFEEIPKGAWQDSPFQALLVPLTQAAQLAPYGFLVVGLNPYRPLDESYRGFVRLIAGHIAAAITDARAYEFERQRAETLAQLDQAKTDFFTNVSHEFRTPLTLLLGPAADALADEAEPLTGRQRGRMEVVLRNGQRLLKLVNSLLDFSRLESGRLASRFEPVDLARSTVELASMFDSAVRGAGLSLTLECEPLSSPAYVDQDHWAKVVLNLLSNALKFTFAGGITVTLREEGGAAVLSVADTGIGIPEAELPHLFDRFHRVPGARSRTHEGSGIGLALVSELVALHSGSIEVASEPGRGTTFTVRLPLGRSHLPSDQVHATAHHADVERQAEGIVSEMARWVDRGDARPTAAAPAATADGRPTVLVVDDNADMRDYIATLLADDYAVVTAADGLEALERVQERVPDLVLTDVMMPNLDGFGLLERLHADPVTLGVPVIMLSARAGEEGTVEGLEAGADDYLVKPFSARELLARVRVNMELDRNRRVTRALERSRDLLDQAQRLARMGSWELDPATNRIVTSDGLLRIVGRSREDVEGATLTEVVAEAVHPDDRERVRELFQAARPGELVRYEARVLLPSGEERLVEVRGEVAVADDGTETLRGSVQDVTEQRRAEVALAEAAAREESAAREHAIADELQRSLLPARTFDVEHLEVATYYRAGVEGTRVGGDWYDIIELGAGRTALVVGDVMGRGVAAASTMGQLRSAVRAFAKLDLPPGEILEHLDGLVQDLHDDQIVTCVYAVFDSIDQTIRYANAGHLPPLLSAPGQPVRKLAAAGPPLGAGFFGETSEPVQLHPAATIALYTDGLVERRDRDLEVGIDELAEQLSALVEADLAELPELLAGRLGVEGTDDDDVAVLVARVNSEPFDAAVSYQLGTEGHVVANARHLVGDQLTEWGVTKETNDDIVLMASEMVTNALVHGRPPIDLRLRRVGQEVILEVHDRAPYRPRRRHADDDDEHGRGLQIVATLADRWGSRPTGTGKSVWCTRLLAEGS